MAKGAPPPDAGKPGPPKDFASVPPPDLYATSDIRFVMLEIGKLTAKVDRLIDDVKGQGTKIDRLRQTVAYVAGGGIVIVFLIGLAVKYLPTPHFDTVSAAPPASAPQQQPNPPPKTP